MKAGVVIENEKIICKDIEEPKVGDNEVKVSVAVTGICGSDVPRVWKNGAHNYPIVLGHEFSGIVAEIGKNVKNINIGDHVVGIPLVPCFKCKDYMNGNYSLCKNYSFVGSRQQGSMAEFVVLPENNVMVIDKSIPLEVAAFFEPSTVAKHAINIIDYKKNKSVVILGGGNIGSFMIQWIKLLGAEKIVVVGRDKEKLAKTIELGATDTVSTLDDDYLEQLKSITNNNGFDYVFETAGSTELIKLSFEIAANKATICYVGTPTSEVCIDFKLWEQINRKEMILTGSWMSYSNPWPGKEWEDTEKEFKNGNLKVTESMIYNRYDLNNIDKAFELYKDNKKPGGKVLIYSDEELYKIKTKGEN